ncbi:hypothetical protein V5F34_08760 [Xanthobacter autotrophicus]|uniref:hypothetical protein n=1 Tax=Xanthobacter autotrophicus TaxID=280 RepID=UPI003729A411
MMTKIEHTLPRDVVTVFHVIEAVQELYGDQAADKVTGRAIERAGYTLPGSVPVLPLNAPPAESGETLGRFGHHPDPAVDFCLEVEVREPSPRLHERCSVAR